MNEKTLNIKVRNIHDVIIAVLTVVIIILLLFIVLSKNSGTNYQSDAPDQQLADAKKRNAELEFDRIRMQDITNITLALQEFYFQKSSLPGKLTLLRDEGFLDDKTSFNDPETKDPYLYQDRTNDFVLCAWLSDAIKGVNIADCPAVRVSASGTPKPSPSASPAASSIPTGNSAMGILQIIGSVASVNVRQQPTTGSAIVTKVKPGDTFQFFALQDDWYQIVAQGIEGWVFKNYTKITSQ